MDFTNLLTQVIHSSREELVLANFGVQTIQLQFLWSILAMSTLAFRPIHLLWALYFLKVYPTNGVFEGKFGTSIKTLLKWTWRVIFYLLVWFEGTSPVCKIHAC
jgi:hypothetical protein